MSRVCVFEAHIVNEKNGKIPSVQKNIEINYVVK